MVFGHAEGLSGVTSTPVRRPTSSATARGEGIGADGTGGAVCSVDPRGTITPLQVLR